MAVERKSIGMQWNAVLGVCRGGKGCRGGGAKGRNSGEKTPRQTRTRRQRCVHVISTVSHKNKCAESCECGASNGAVTRRNTAPQQPQWPRHGAVCCGRHSSAVSLSGRGSCCGAVSGASSTRHTVNTSAHPLGDTERNSFGTCARNSRRHSAALPPGGVVAAGRGGLPAAPCTGMAAVSDGRQCAVRGAPKKAAKQRHTAAEMGGTRALLYQRTQRPVF